MKRLTEADRIGNWRLKGMDWEDIAPGAAITKKLNQRLYGALCKLRDYENTGLDPEEVNELNDFDQNQSMKLLKKLNEEQNKHRWIPVGERMPAENGTYICTLNGELVGEEEPFTGMCGITDGEWDETECVIAWMPLPEPYREEKQCWKESSMR